MSCSCTLNDVVHVALVKLKTDPIKNWACQGSADIQRPFQHFVIKFRSLGAKLQCNRVAQQCGSQREARNTWLSETSGVLFSERLSNVDRQVFSPCTSHVSA